MAYRLVIFDFDGTLADSAAWLARVLDGVAERYRFRKVGAEEMRALQALDTGAILRHLGVPVWKLPVIARHMRQLAARDAGEIRLFDGAAPLLASLSDNGVALAIVSSNSEATIRRILEPENAGLIAFYACGAALFGKAAKFRAVLSRSGIPPSAALAIGDEARDIDAAREASIDAGAVTWGYAAEELLRERKPQRIFRNFVEILEYAREPRLPEDPECQGKVESARTLRP